MPLRPPPCLLNPRVLAAGALLAAAAASAQSQAPVQAPAQAQTSEDWAPALMVPATLPEIRLPDLRDIQLAVPRPVRAAQAALGMGKQRLALVIGLGQVGRRSVVDSAPRDVLAVASALRSGGFVVMLREDLGAADLRAALKEFRERLQPGGVGFIYVTALGAQVDGQNLLLTRDALLDAPEPALAQRLRQTAVPLDEVSDALIGSPDSLRLLVVDAAWQHPALAALPQAGLAQPRLPHGMMALFSQPLGSVQEVPAVAPLPLPVPTAAAEIAATPFTRTLVGALLKPRINGPEALRSTRRSIADATLGQSSPWLGGDTDDKEELAEASLLDGLIPRTPEEVAREALRQGSRGLTRPAARVAGEQTVAEVMAQNTTPAAAPVSATTEPAATRPGSTTPGTSLASTVSALGTAASVVGTVASTVAGVAVTAQVVQTAAAVSVATAAATTAVGVAGSAASALGSTAVALAARAGGSSSSGAAVAGAAAAPAAVAIVAPAAALAGAAAAGAAGTAGAAVPAAAPLALAPAGAAIAVSTAALPAAAAVGTAPVSADTVASDIPAPVASPSTTTAQRAAQAAAAATEALPGSQRVVDAAPAAQAAQAAQAAARALPRRNAYGYTEGDSFSYQVLDTWADEVVGEYTTAIDEVLANGQLRANGQQMQMDPQGRPTRLARPDGSFSVFEPHQDLWWAKPERGQRRAVKFIEKFQRADQVRGETEWRGGSLVARATKIDTPAGSFDVLPIESRGSWSETLASGARSTGQWSRTVYYSPKLQHPVAIEVRDLDAQGRLLRRERIQLLHAQQARGTP